MSTETKNEVKMEDIDGLDEDVPEKITLISKDNVSFELNRKAAFISNLIKTSMDSDDKSVEVPVPGVNGHILELVVKYMEHYKDSESDAPEKPLKSTNLEHIYKEEFDVEFFRKYITKEDDKDRKIKNQELYDLILAANYMDMNKLLHKGCATVALNIKGQPLEKIKNILSVE